MGAPLTYLPIRALSLLWTFLYLPLLHSAMAQTTIPENAIRAYGGGWTCAHGYRKAGGHCERIALPENGVLNYTGNDWLCARGFYKSGQRCAKVNVPENARLDYLGTGWTCTRGYYKSGNSCAKLVLPEHATLDYTGNNWTCVAGYKRAADKCVPLSAKEMEGRRAVKEQVRKKMAERQRRIAAGQDCQSEYKTNAEVCVQVTRVQLNCNESILDNYYNDCDVTLNYDVKTNYAGRSSLSADVECKVEIEYSGRNTLLTTSDSARKSDTHTLYASSALSERFRYSFSFGMLDEVTHAKLTSARCEIESLNLW